MFGFGPGTFIAAFQQHVSTAHIHEDAIWASAHNDWLQYFVEWGFFGGMVWLVLWAIPSWKAAQHFWVMVKPAFALERRRTRRSRERWHRSFEALRMYLCFGVSLALVGVLVHAAIDFPLQIMGLQIYAFTLAGIVSAKSRTDTDEPAEDE
jgi:O-antigen ligase